MQVPDSRSAADMGGKKNSYCGGGSGWCQALGSSQKAQGGGGKSRGKKYFLSCLEIKSSVHCSGAQQLRKGQELMASLDPSAQQLAWKSCCFLGLCQTVVWPWRCWARCVSGAARPPAPSPASPHPSGIPAAKATWVGLRSPAVPPSSCLPLSSYCFAPSASLTFFCKFWGHRLNFHY